MGEFARKADGRRIFTVEFKRGIVQQLVKGEKTLAEVSWELDIQPSVIREWKRRGRDRGDHGRGRDRGCRAGQRAPGGAAADSGARATARPEADGGRNPAGGAGRRRKGPWLRKLPRQVDTSIVDFTGAEVSMTRTVFLR
jgi:transposase-like protein